MHYPWPGSASLWAAAAPGVPPRSVQGLPAQERIAACPQLSGRRLLREIRALGYDGGYTAVTDFLRSVRPPATEPFEVRFETPPGRQAQVDFAQFQVEFTDEPFYLAAAPKAPDLVAPDAQG